MQLAQAPDPLFQLDQAHADDVSARLLKKLKVGECVVYRDFVAAYNCEGSKREIYLVTLSSI